MHSFEISLYLCLHKRGNSSVGRAQPCQGWGREFESRFPLRNRKSPGIHRGFFRFPFCRAGLKEFPKRFRIFLYSHPMLKNIRSGGKKSVSFCNTTRRGARVVESGGLENRCARKCTVGSNPTLSAENRKPSLQAGVFDFGFCRTGKPSIPHCR